jgi:hypothetical protein
LRDLAEELGYIPTRGEVEAHPDPQYDIAVYEKLFDNGYEEARTRLNMDRIWDKRETENSHQISTGELMRELRRLTESLGRPPRAKDMRCEGQYSVKTYYNRFENNWGAILNKAGLDKPSEPNGGQFTKIPNEELIQDVHEVASDLGCPPSMKEYRARGSYAPNTIARRIGNEFWQGAMREICNRVDDDVLTLDGIHKQGGSTEIPDEALEKDVEYVRALIGHPPSIKEYQQFGSHNFTTVARRFGSGSWEEAMRTVLGKYSRSSGSLAKAD